MPGIADLFAGSAPPSQPVINAPTALNNLDAEQAQNQQRMAQTAMSTQDIQNKQRAMQINMLSGVLNEPDPQKQAALAQQLIPIANKLNPSYQIDENASPEMIKGLVMSQVPVEQQPQYTLNQAMVPVMRSIRQQLEGGQSPSAPGTAPGATGGQSQTIPPKALALMATVPGMDKAAQTINDIQKTTYESPQGKGQTAYNEKSGQQLAANEAEMQILKTQLEGYGKALEPDPELGGKSPAEIAPGGEAGQLQTEFTNAFPNFPIIANKQNALAYTKLQNLLNPAAAEAARANFNRVTGQEYKTMQSSQGLDAEPGNRPSVIRQSIQQIQKRMLQLQQENQRLGGQVGVNGSTPAIAGGNGAPPPASANGGGNASLNVREQAESILAAKQAIARGAPTAAVRQRLLGAGINPSLAGL